MLIIYEALHSRMLTNKIKNFRAVLVDIDDTLYDYEAANKLALAAVYESFVTEFNSLTRSEFYSIYRKFRIEITARYRGSGASRSRFLAFQALLEHLKIPCAYSLALDMEETYWSSLIASMQPIMSVVDLLKQLRDLEIPVCAVTDMQVRVQAMKIRSLGLERYIDFMVSSEEAGCEKPSKIIFELALKKLSVPAKDVLMIGDSIKKDMVGAIAMGMHAWHIKHGNLVVFKE